MLLQRFFSSFSFFLLFFVDFYAQTYPSGQLDTLIKQKEYTAALQYIPLLLSQQAAQTGKQDTFYWNILYTKAEVHYYLNDFERCTQTLDELEALLLQTPYKDSTYYANILNYKGVVYAIWTDFKQAEQNLLLANTLYKKNKGIHSVKYISNLNNLSILYQKQGRTQASVPLFQETAQLYERTHGKKSIPYSKVINNLANAYAELNQYALAEKLLLEVLQIREQLLGKEDLQYGRSLSNLADVYLKWGYFEQTENLYLEVLEIYKKTITTTHPDYLQLLSNLASCYTQQQEYRKALPLLHEIASTYQTAYPSDYAYITLVYQDMGRCYRALNDGDNALLYHQKALELQAKKFGKESRFYAASLVDLGNVYQSQHAYLLAEPYYRNALQTFKKESGQYYNHHVFECLNYLITNDLKQKKWQQAETDLQETLAAHLRCAVPDIWADVLLQALPAYQPTDAEVWMGVLDRMANLAQTYYHQHKEVAWLQKAQFCYNLLLKIKADYRKQLLFESDKLFQSTKLDPYLAGAMEVAYEYYQRTPQPQQLDQLLQIAEQGRAQILAEQLHIQDMAQRGYLPDSLIGQKNTWIKQKNELKKTILESTDSAQIAHSQTQLSQLNQTLYRFEQQLQRDYPLYHKSKFQSVPLDIAFVQQQLPPTTAILEYLAMDSVLFAFVLTKKQLYIHKFSTKLTDCWAQVAILQRSLTAYQTIQAEPTPNYQDYTQSAFALYQQLVEPLLVHLSGVSHLLVVPDKTLHYIPFEALLTAAPTARQDYATLPYLLRQYAVSYAHSITLLQENWQMKPQAIAATHGKGLLAIAADYTSKDSLSGMRTARQRDMRKWMQPLSAAQQEVQALANHWQGDFWWDRPQTTETQFKTRAADYAVLHLAMHGMLDKHHPMLSALAFTEDGDSTNDNFLQAHEISLLDLQAQLVVLSACETGYGKFSSGEGVLSLGRAFMNAGVPALLVSLWEVNDVSTSRIMPDFYRYLSQGLPKSEALRRAKLQYIEQANGISAHPAYWAAFVVQGDDAPVSLVARSSGYVFWLLAAASAGIAALSAWVFVQRRRR